MNCFKNSVATRRPRVLTESFSSPISLSISYTTKIDNSGFILHFNNKKPCNLKNCTQPSSNRSNIGEKANGLGNQTLVRLIQDGQTQAMCMSQIECSTSMG